MIWKSDLRGHDGRLSERILTANPREAEAHFRRLLARVDLLGQPVAARLVSPLTRGAIYFSRFDREIGDGRIHPDAPLNLFCADNGAAEATRWRPCEIDYNAPFQEIQRQWMVARNLTNEQAADLLRINRETWKSWRYGKSACSQSEALKLLMQRI